MSEWGLNQTTVSAVLAVDGANTASFYFDTPVKIIKWGFITTVDVTVADSVLTMNHLDSSGGALDPTGAAEGGTCTIAFGTAGEVDKGCYRDIATTYELIVIPGERIDIVSDGGATAGDGRTFIVYQPLPTVDVNFRSNATIPGAVTASSWLANLTKVTA